MRPSPTLFLSALVAGGLLAHGCATVSSSVIVPERLTVDRTLGGSVDIEAVGTGRQALVGRPLIESDTLYVALRESLLTAGVFDDVIERKSGLAADRVLSVNVERLEEPSIGLDSTCKVAMRWRLMNGERTRTVWEEVVHSKETITSYNELDSSKRGQLAIEGALRANIRRGIERLSRAPNR